MFEFLKFTFGIEKKINSMQDEIDEIKSKEKDFLDLFDDESNKYTSLGILREKINVSRNSSCTYWSISRKVVSDFGDMADILPNGDGSYRVSRENLFLVEMYNHTDISEDMVNLINESNGIIISLNPGSSTLYKFGLCPNIKPNSNPYIRKKIDRKYKTTITRKKRK